MAKAGAAVGTALAAAGTAAIYFGKQVIDGLDALNDVRDATGSSIENISALEDVALRTGTSFDTVQGALIKFNNTLKEADGKNGASQALKAIGLDAEKLKAIDPAEALRQTAAALATFADDGDKARLVQELFGKSVREVAPFLKDLAEKTELVGTVTTAQAQAAEDFNKQLFALQKGATDLGRTLVSDLLPSVQRVIEEFTIGRKTAGGFLDAILTFGTINPFKTQQSNLKGLREEIEGLEKDRARYVNSKSDTRGIDDAIRNSKKQYDYLKQLQARDALAGAGDTGDAVSRRFMRPEVLASVGPLPASTPKPKSAGGGSKESELQRYIENLGKQLDKTKELSVAEQVLSDVQSGRLKLQKGETIDRAVAMAKEVDAAKAMVEYRKLSAEAEKERDAVLLKSAEAQEEQAKGLIEGNKAMREETELLGKSVEAQAAIEKARISSKVALLEENLARSESSGALVRETDAIRAQIDALTERKDLLGERAVAQRLKQDADEAKEFASAVGAAFESSFEKAILEGGKLSDVIGGLIKDIAQLVIRQQITGPLAKAIGGGGSTSGASGSGLAGIWEGVSKWWSGLSFASGGNPPVGKASLIGENGPELFVPRTAGTIIPNHALSMGGGTTVINNSFTVGDVASMQQVKKAIAASQQQTTANLRRSRNYAGEAAVS